MSSETKLLVRPITPGDVASVGRFLNATLNPRLSPQAWAEAIVPPWTAPTPNHGFMLTQGDQVVGANLAFYSERTIAGRSEAFCNLGALSVVEAARPHTFRLVRAILKQSGYHFTDLSPSGNVVELDKRLGFQPLDTSTVLTVNTPRPPAPGTSLVSDPGEIDRVLTGPDLAVFRDHRRARAARHLLVLQGPEQCYVMFRRDRRKNLPLFASILYVGNRGLYRAVASQVGSHLLLHCGLPATLSEARVVGFTPARSYPLPRPRAKLYKTASLPDTDIDYLYSELTCVPW